MEIRRDWLNRIGGYGEVFRPKPGSGKPGSGSPDDGKRGQGEDDTGDPTGDHADAGGDNPTGQWEPGEETGGASGEQVTPPPLAVPEEVARERGEQERRERERKATLGRQNLALAPQAFALQGHHLRGLAARFARMVSKVAEDSADLPTQGDDEWDLAELRQRRFTGRLVSQCRMTREKRKVAVVLDTSPSCEQQARLFAAVARVAEELGDCELYDAPNFVIYSRHLGRQWERLPESEREWDFRGRVVLAFGDFDGIERICAASTVRGNRIYWFSCEQRPPVLESNRDTLVRRFRGRYLPAADINSLMEAMRKVR